jgi:hypothetical protein
MFDKKYLDQSDSKYMKSGALGVIRARKMLIKRFKTLMKDESMRDGRTPKTRSNLLDLGCKRNTKFYYRELVNLLDLFIANHLIDSEHFNDELKEFMEFLDE